MQSRLTKAGLSLLAKEQAGQALPNVTRVVAGAGYTAPDLLEEQTDINEPIAEMETGEQQLINGMIVRLSVQLSNLGLTEDVGISQIGVFSEDPDKGEILYHIIQYDTPYILPAHSGNSGGVILFDPELDLLFANAELASVPITPGFLVTRNQLSEHNLDEDAHPAILHIIEELAGEGIGAHNTDDSAHPDIRTEMARKANQADVYDKATVDSKIANATPPTATGSSKGIVQLSDAVNATSNVGDGTAATPAAVKSAYDLANTANTTANNANSAAGTAQTRADSAYNLANTANGTANSALNFAQTSKYRWHGGASNVGTITLPDSGVVVSISWTIHRVMDTLIAGCTAEWTGTVSEGEYNSVIISVPNQNGIFAVQAPVTISSDSLSISFAGAAVTGDMTWIVGFVARERPTDYNWNLILTGGRQMRSCFQACIPLTSYYDTGTAYPPTTIYP